MKTASLGANSVVHRLLCKLENYTSLPEEDRQALARTSTQIKKLGAHQDMIKEGDRSGGINLLLEGFACRYKVLPDGRRQIVAYFVPGDLCDLRVFVLRRMDHSIATLAPSRFAVLPREAMLQLTANHPLLARAFWWSTLVEESITREWVVNVGQRSAFERMAHLFCEIYTRLHSVGLVENNTCFFPVTQAELADTLALSTVHVNRTLKELRTLGLVSVRGKELVVHDLKQLQNLAMFNANYLHMDGAPLPERQIGNGEF